MIRRLQRPSKTVRAIARIATLTVLLVSVFAATVRAGTQHYFCTMMQEQRAEPCCDRQPTQGLLPEVHVRSCCQSVVVDALPDGTATQLRRVGPAPLATAVGLPAAVVHFVSPTALGLRTARAPRAGPPPSMLALARRTVLRM